jgi:diaminopimelate epimerase
VKFTKMHGVGNDFVVVDCIETTIPEDQLATVSARVCERKYGVGADGLILVLPSKQADFRMRMFNPDGSEAEMCGNGIRCFAKFVYDRRLTTETQFRADTLAGVKVLKLQTKAGRVESVRVDMGCPRLRRSEIPMRGDESEVVIAEPVRVNGRRFDVTAVSMGNPHAVVFEGDLAALDIAKYGPLIENHRLFPKRTNVQFVQVLTNTEIVVRTWERGAGVTLACGTGACASVVAGSIAGKTAKRAVVHLLGGDLQIDWTGDNRVIMTGPATEVFEGTYDLADI